MEKAKESGRSRKHLFQSNAEYLNEFFGLLRLLCLKRLAEKRSSEDPDKDEETSRPSRKRTEERSCPPQRLEEASLKYEESRKQFEESVRLTLEVGSPELPLKRLSSEFSLSPHEEAVLATVLAYNSRSDFEKALDSASGTGRLTVKAMMKLLADSDEERQELRRLFLPQSKLMKNSLLNSSRNWRRLSEEDFLGMNLEIPLGISSLILGQEEELINPQSCYEIFAPRASLDDLCLPEETLSELREASQPLLEEQGRIVVLHGPAGVGKSTAAEGLASELGMKVMKIETLPYLRKYYEDRDDLISTLSLARLQRAAIVFDFSDPLLDQDPFDDVGPEVFVEELSKFEGLVVLTTRSTPTPTGCLVQAADFVIGLRMPEAELREVILRRALGANLDLADDLDLKKLSSSLALSGGQLQRLALRAKRQALSRPEEERSLRASDFKLHGSQAQTSATSADSPTSVITPRTKLRDVILDDSLRKSVEEIIKAVSSRETVLLNWGFGDTYSTGHGIAALFYGPSGTGKTLTAEAIAGELGVPLRSIQISGILNKYVGETEKRIVEVFRSQSSSSKEVLLADEADALFTSRVQNSEHNAYYINSHINTILAEMDRFKGIIILSSNRPLALDEAFERRIAWKLEFPKPVVELREKLWRTLIPSNAPLADDIDFEELARKYDYTGGIIRSVLLKAAYVAAADGQAISMRHINGACKSEIQIADSLEESSGIGFRSQA